MSHSLPHVVIGGGAAGFFGACACAKASKHKVILLEKTKQLLSKVRISGGGRCNVTHSCFDAKKLIQNYPRGSKELLGPFHEFGPKNTIAWFTERGVTLKTEEDGRMFPDTDSSETIIECLMKEASSLGIEIRTECGIKCIHKQDTHFSISLENGEILYAQNILIATGSARPIFSLLESLGHTIQEPVPSLFTLNIPTSPLLDLSGISVHHAKARIADTNLIQEGPLLITHWGFSGPCILKLSAWGARILHKLNYNATLHINWIPEYSHDKTLKTLQALRNSRPTQHVLQDPQFMLPKNLWKKFAELSGINAQTTWTRISHKNLVALTEALLNSTYKIEGKTTYKQEFVTAGGVTLNEIDFKTMQSKIIPGLFFAGEVLDIDGITGGFNFQNAWTTSWIAGNSMAKNS